MREGIERPQPTERVFNLAGLKSPLGESLVARHRFAEAEPVLLEAFEAQKSHVPPAAPLRVKAED